MNTPSRPPQVTQTKAYALAALGLGIFAQTASAADVTWLGNTSGAWSTGTNWSTSAVPTNGSTLVFGAPGTGGLALSNAIVGLTVGGVNTDGISFGAGSAAYSISGQAVTLASSGTGVGIKVFSPFVQTISGPLVYSGNQTIQVGAVTGPALSSLTLSGIQSGGARLIKTGNGLLTLSGANLLGGLTINSGTVSITTDAHLSSSATAPASPTAGWITLAGGTLRTNANGSFAINANRGIALGDGTTGSGGTLNVFTSGSAGTLTYNGVIANNGGANTLTKTGTQTLSLGGANTYTGATKIDQGQVTLDFTAATAPTSNIIDSSSALVMGNFPVSLGNNVAGSPILLVQGSNTAARSQTFNGTTINAGNASIIARGGSGANATTVALGALSHTTGGTVGFTLINNGGTAAITTTTANTNGILGGFATSGASAVGSGVVPVTQTDWATRDISGNIVAYTGYTDVQTGGITSASASNVRIVNPTTKTLSGGATTSASNVVTVTSTAGLNVGDTVFGSGIPTNATVVSITDATHFVMSANSASTTSAQSYVAGIPQGNVTLSAGTTDINTLMSTDLLARTVAIGTGNTLRLGTYGGVWKTEASSTALSITGGTLTAGGPIANTAGEIVFNANGAASTNQTIAVSSVIADNGTGAVAVVKTGMASASLSGINTYSGGTFVNQGTLIATNANAFGGAGKTVTVLSGATATLNAGSLTYANNFNLAGTAALILGGNTVSGQITLLGDTVIGSGASTAGGTITGKITGDYNLSFLSNVTTLSETTNDYSGNLGINGTAGPLGAATVTVKLGNNEVLSNGAGKGNVYISGGTAGPAVLDLNGKTETINGLISGGSNFANTRVTNTAATASILTLGDNNQTATFGGVILDGSVTGTVRIVKIGDGVQTFSGSNTYTGGTAVNAGTLAFGASFTMSGANQVTVAGAGVAGINYATIKSTSGTVTFGGTLDINITTSLLGGENFSIFSANGGALAGSFTGVSVSGSYVGALTNNAGIWTGTINGIDFNFSTIGGNIGQLSAAAASAVPEPSTYAAIFGALVLGIAISRRRRVK